MTTPPMRTEPWLTRGGIAHGFFGRRGGVSTGIFASLNCGLGSSDERANVIANRDLAARALEKDAKLLTAPPNSQQQGANRHRPLGDHRQSGGRWHGHQDGRNRAWYFRR